MDKLDVLKLAEKIVSSYLVEGTETVPADSLLAGMVDAACVLLKKTFEEFTPKEPK